MCLSEPQAGSSLSDITTRAVPDGEDFEDDPLGPRYRLRGNKMWISAGEHELTENIVHLVLAKIPGPDGKLVPAPAASRCSSCPSASWSTPTAAHRRAQRRGAGRPEPQVRLARHDQHAAELRRRPVPARWRRARRRRGAIGYRVGQPGEGLRCMFHMMNEARIASAWRGDAGHGRLRGVAGLRPPASAGPADHRRRQGRRRAAGAIIEHADVKRMLLAQKAYAKARWRWSCTAPGWWTSSTPASAAAAREAGCCWRC
jgi:alkylation response protein AidB-like acyl-CoA dehydrogenase